MSKINPKNPYSHRYIALSRDLFNHYKFGDTIVVSGTEIYDGLWVVRDKMNKRWKKRIDFLVNSDMPIDKWLNVKIKRKI